MPDASDASADASAAYPRPCARPGLPGDDAREIESRRAVRAKARGESLAASDVPVLRRDDADADADGDGGGAFVVVRKPAGVYVDDVLAALERDASASASASPSPSPRRLHLAHRLDRDTSGCLVVATSTRACAALTRAFADGKVRKEYLAHCSSAAASSSSEPREPDPSPSPSLDGARPLTLRTGHGRSRNGLWRVYPLSDVGRALPRDPGRKTTLVKIAETSLVVVATAAARGGGGGGERSRCAYVRATPTTGRTHQVRSIQKFFTHCPVSTFDRMGPFQLTGEPFLYGMALRFGCTARTRAPRSWGTSSTAVRASSKKKKKKKKRKRKKRKKMMR
jgi:hypothetical protein